MTQHLDVVRVGVAAATTVTVKRCTATDARPQGLVLDADSMLRVADHASPRVVLWNTTAPDTVEIVTTAAGELRIWNVWRDGDLIQAWQGCSGIEVDDEGDDLGLCCTDGHGGSSGDLVVRLSFDRAWTQPATDDGPDDSGQESVPTGPALPIPSTPPRPVPKE